MSAVLAVPRIRPTPLTATWLRPPLVLGLLAFLLYLQPAVRVVQLNPDVVEYVDVARRLLAGEGYVLGVKAYHFGGTDVLHDGLAERPPLFVWLVAALLAAGAGLHGVQVANALLAAACVGLVAAVAGRLFGPRVALASGALAAASPVMLARLVPPMTEALAIGLALAAVWAVLVGLERPRVLPLAAAGLALGLGYLTRPTSAVLLPALALSIVLGMRDWRASVRPVGALVAGALLLMVPISLYSLATRGTPSYSGQTYLYAVFKDSDVVRNGYGRELPTPREFIAANWEFVLVAIGENARDYAFLLFADRDWLWPLLFAVPLVGVGIVRGWYPRATMVVGLAAAANFAVYAATWANYQERYQILTLLLLLPLLVRGIDGLIGGVVAYATRQAGDSSLAMRLGGAVRAGLLAALVLGVAASWSRTFVEEYRGEFRYGDEPTRARVDGGLRWTGPPRWVQDNDLARVVDWVNANTGRADVLAHREPWPYTFFTRRPATLLPTKLTAERLRGFLVEYRVAYLLLDTRDRDRRAYADDLDALAAEGVTVTSVGSHRVYDTRALWGGR